MFKEGEFRILDSLICSVAGSQPGETDPTEKSRKEPVPVGGSTCRVANDAVIYSRQPQAQ